MVLPNRQHTRAFQLKWAIFRAHFRCWQSVFCNLNIFEPICDPKKSTGKLLAKFSIISRPFQISCITCEDIGIHFVSKWWEREWDSLATSIMHPFHNWSRVPNSICIQSRNFVVRVLSGRKWIHFPALWQQIEFLSKILASGRYAKTPWTDKPV